MEPGGVRGGDQQRASGCCQHRTNDLASAWLEEDWECFGPLLRQALVEALGAPAVREALTRNGWDPILYLFLVGEGMVDEGTAPRALRAGRWGCQCTGPESAEPAASYPFTAPVMPETM